MHSPKLAICVVNCMKTRVKLLESWVEQSANGSDRQSRGGAFMYLSSSRAGPAPGWRTLASLACSKPESQSPRLYPVSADRKLANVIYRVRDALEELEILNLTAICGALSQIQREVLL